MAQGHEPQDHPQQRRERQQHQHQARHGTDGQGLSDVKEPCAHQAVGDVDVGPHGGHQAQGQVAQDAAENAGDAGSKGAAYEGRLRIEA